MFKYTWLSFKLDFLENEASYEQILFYIFVLLFRRESPDARLYVLFDHTLYGILSKH